MLVYRFMCGKFLFLSQLESFNLKQGLILDLGEGYNCCDLCNCKRPTNFMSLEADFCLMKLQISSEKLFFNLL